MKKIVLIVMVALLVAVPVEAKRGATGPSPIGVYDANGAFVGTLVNVLNPTPLSTAYQEMEVLVWLPDLAMFTILIKETGHSPSNSTIPRILYMESDCRGPGYAMAGFVNQMPDLVMGFGTEFYSIVAGSYMGAAITVSQRISGGSCENTTPDDHAVWELTPVTFTAPTGPLTLK